MPMKTSLLDFLRHNEYIKKQRRYSSAVFSFIQELFYAVMPY